MKRIRLLVYDYDTMTPEEIEKHRSQEWCSRTKMLKWNANATISNFELNPMELTLTGLHRLFKREASDAHHE